MCLFDTNTLCFQNAPVLFSSLLQTLPETNVIESHSHHGPNNGESTRVNNDSPAMKFRLILECYLSNSLTEITGNVCKAQDHTATTVSKAVVNNLSSKDQRPRMHLAGKRLLVTRSPSKGLSRVFSSTATLKEIQPVHPKGN